MNIILSGAGGRMGKEFLRLSDTGYKGAEVVAGVDVREVPDCTVKCFTDWNDINITADCIVDFSNHVCTDAILTYALSKKLPVVIATTGQTAEEIQHIKDAANTIPVFFSANMSLGVALLVELAKTTVKNMPDADIEIVEIHHNRKADAPSGTALMIANALKEIREKAFLVFGRSGQCKRDKNEIGMHSLRMGNIVGEHEVIVSTDAETITIKHEAHSRALFADGAATAASFIINQPAGLYNMQDMIKEDREK